MSENHTRVKSAEAKYPLWFWHSIDKFSSFLCEFLAHALGQNWVGKPTDLPFPTSLAFTGATRCCVPHLHPLSYNISAVGAAHSHKNVSQCGYSNILQCNIFWLSQFPLPDLGTYALCRNFTLNTYNFCLLIFDIPDSNDL